MKMNYSKDEIHLRMIELQEKLRNSEKERKKLEKTCEILINAFKEKQKIHYSNLYSKYEKFIEDCNIRRKRNEIILRSINRVEDKAKAIFAKTETLKLYKERYVSYLKQNEFLKNSQRNISTLSQDPSYHGVISKSVHWKTPNVADVQEFNADEFLKQNKNEKLDIETDLLRKENLTTEFDEKSKSQKQDDYLYNLKRNGVNHNNFKSESPLQSIYQSKYLNESLKLSDKNNSEDIPYNAFQAIDSIKGEAKESNKKNNENQIPIENVSLTNVTSLFSNVYDDNKIKGLSHGFETETGKNDDFTLSEIKNRTYDNAEENRILLTESNQKNLMPTEVIEDFKGSLDKETPKVVNLYGSKKECSPKIIEKEELEASEKENTLKDANKILRVTDYSYKDIPSIENLVKIKEKNEMEKKEESLEFHKDFEQSEFFDSQRKNSDENIEPLGEKIYPTGMDGVDFNNETYPDSYYEQPTHTQSFSNITSNVILEEDEFDEDIDQFEPEPLVKNLNNSNQNSVSEERNYDESIKFLPTESLQVNNSSVQHLKDEKLLKTLKNNGEDSNTFIDLRHSIINDISKHDSYDSDSGKTDSNRGNTCTIKTKKSESNNSNEILKADNNNSIEKIKDLTISTKSNLAHLLESDSESFQIEHGEIISGNEDSDFDFSFNQNP